MITLYKKFEVSRKGKEEIIFQIDIFFVGIVLGGIGTSFPQVPKHLHLCHDARKRRK